MDLLGVRSLPFLARRNYYYEFKHLLLWSALAGLIEGQFASIIVAKTFGGGKLLITIATATPAACYIFSLFWGMLCVGRPKIRVITMLGVGAVLLTGSIAAIPASPRGAVWFICQIAAVQILLAGVVTVRSALWKSNYPHSARGRITARLQAVRFVISISAVLLAAWACDRDPNSYRFVFPCVAGLGAVALLVLGRIHMRGERNELARAQTPERQTDQREGLVEPLNLTALLSPGRVLGRMVDILRRDRKFARYCVAQALTGLSNFMTLPVIVAVITRELDIGFAWGFWISTALIQAMPQLFRLGTLHRWARLFDRVGVIRFRVVSVAVWSVSLVFGMAATLVAISGDRIGPVHLPLAVGLFALRGLGNGIALGAGALAWNLGHLHFARSDEAEVYMGVHVFLTGLRGLIAPAVGMLLWTLVGAWVWIVAIALAVLSGRMYLAMAREELAGETRESEARLKVKP